MRIISRMIFFSPSKYTYREETSLYIGVLIIKGERFVVSSLIHRIDDSSESCIRVDFVEPTETTILFATHPRSPISAATATVARGTRKDTLVPDNLSRGVETDGPDASITGSGLAVGSIVPSTIIGVGNHSCTVCQRMKSGGGLSSRSIRVLHALASAGEFGPRQASGKGKSQRRIIIRQISWKVCDEGG